MPQGAARNAIIRLTCFAGAWVIALGVRNSQRGDPNWMRKVAWMAAFAVPAVFLLWLMQRLARYRIPWLVEMFGLPFAIGALVYVAIAIREFLGRLA